MTTSTNHKLTIRQEKFCHAYVETGNASEAYRRTYDCSKWKDKSVWEKESTLLANVKAQSRVDQLRAQIRKPHEITVDDIVAELEEARAVALKNDTAASMFAASMGKAKLLGLVVDNREGWPAAASGPDRADNKRPCQLDHGSLLREANIQEQDTADENRAEVVGVLVWGGIWLRDRNLRACFPLRSGTG